MHIYPTCIQMPISSGPFTTKGPPNFLNDQIIKSILSAPGLKFSVQQCPGGIPAQDLKVRGIRNLRRWRAADSVSESSSHGEISMNIFGIQCMSLYIRQHFDLSYGSKFLQRLIWLFWCIIWIAQDLNPPKPKPRAASRPSDQMNKTTGRSQAPPRQGD